MQNKKMGALIDLTGQKFGRWTVLKKDPNKYPNHVIKWICRCDCGTEKSVMGRHLKEGTSLSCGCLRNEKQSEERTKDLTGQKFGHLTVLRKYTKTNLNKQGTYWECQCDCGNPEIKIVRSNHLTTGETKSCGICTNWNFSTMVMEHDLLKRLNYDFNTKKWNVQCKSCGSITQMTGDNFIKNKSCGCIKSLGEYKIAQLLTNNKISFEKEKTFPNFISNKNGSFRFDFYVNNTYIIEYDGIQHFIQGNNHFNNPEKFKLTQEHDNLKNQWCKDNNIPLIRIPYTHLNDLCFEDLQLETSKFII